MKFSLIMATFGRGSELERMFESLTGQTCDDFELIVVDQNLDDRVRRVVERFAGRLDIVYLRSEKGLSRARNVGLQAARGEIVAFPDDDCWYAPDTLAFVLGRFAEDRHLAGLTGCTVDDSGKPSQGRWATRSMLVDRYNIWTCACSATIFLRVDAASAAGRFDEQLGVGAGTRWGAGEEVNFLLGALRSGMRVRYDPQLRIGHPEPLEIFDDKAFSRGRLYNRGFGRVLRLNRYPAHYVSYMIARAVAGCVLSIIRYRPARARYYWIAASQRLLGWMD
ncbi:glycosyltransferase family 2 protein [Paraburkholderia xenovorans]|uniref:glycosyltransferase family 2 protein n=1 Tax=Paraburkholderia xenovorans TaxID=36873 RepID=UPI0038BA52DF